MGGMPIHATEERRAIARAPLLRPSPLERYRETAPRRVLHEHVALFTSDVPGPDGNSAFVFGPIAPDAFFALADAHFAAAGGYSVAVEVESAPAIVAALEANGWEMDEEEPALVLSALPAAIPAPPRELAIRRVLNEAELADFRAITGTGTQILPSLAAARDPDVACFVGYVSGVPAATARLVCFGAVAEITGVVTVPEYRRRGYGTALTWAAVAEGAARACTATTLTASPLGYPVYVRMGFQPVCTYRTYLPPLPLPDTGISPGGGGL
jgi:GNAT superfamily N-acetyltransferase